METRRQAPFPVLGAALAGSALLHLSAITLFSIVLYFPKESIQYYDLFFYEAETPAASSAELLPGAAFPASELPRLTFGVQLAELAPPIDTRLRITGDDLALRERIGLGTSEPAPDSWERFGEGIQQVREGLRRLTLSSPSDLVLDAGGRADVVEVAPGLYGSFDWPAGNARDILYAPPAMISQRLPEEVEFTLQINSDGRVGRAWTSAVEPMELLRTLQETLERYRFEPKASTVTLDDTVQLRIVPSGRADVLR